MTFELRHQRIVQRLVTLGVGGEVPCDAAEPPGGRRGEGRLSPAVTRKVTASASRLGTLLCRRRCNGQTSATMNNASASGAIATLAC